MELKSYNAKVEQLIKAAMESILARSDRILTIDITEDEKHMDVRVTFQERVLEETNG